MVYYFLVYYVLRKQNNQINFGDKIKDKKF